MDFFKTSKASKKGVFEFTKRQTPFEINARMIAFAREIGLGLSALKASSKFVNFPPPMNRGFYDNLFNYRTF